jgi:ubiquinone/menaquinone biosynthesis C-methylase UbiE
MEPRLQRRVQRYGWDLAATSYEPLWRAQLAPAQQELLRHAALACGERVLDVACGTGATAVEAAAAVAPAAGASVEPSVAATGCVVGIDLSGRMIDAARRRAEESGIGNATFARMDAENLDLPDASFDVVLCSLGLMYVPDPARALREMRRVLHPGGRLVAVVWGDRSLCGWSPLFSIIDDEVETEVCPLFFRLGENDNLAELCREASFDVNFTRRMPTMLEYADEDAACRAAFVGGPVALAWSRFDDDVRTRIRRCYVEALAQWKHDPGYLVPGEFVLVKATA